MSTPRSSSSRSSYRKDEPNQNTGGHNGGTSTDSYRAGDEASTDTNEQSDSADSNSSGGRTDSDSLVDLPEEWVVISKTIVA